MTALIFAAASNQLNIMEILVEAGADLEKAGSGGITPLMCADMGASTAAVEWLLARGSDWRTTDNLGATALKLTTTRNERDSEVAMVLQAWAVKHSTTAGEPAAMNLALDPEALEDSLRVASRHGRTEEVQRLLAQGVNVNAANSQGTTALHLAAAFNHVNIMEIIVEAGADLDKANPAGITPLMGAAARGATAAVEWLLTRGADWRQTNNLGGTALTLAQHENGFQIAQVLKAWALKHSSHREPEPAAMDPALDPKALEDLLRQAAADGLTVEVQRLLAQGIQANAADGHGMTALIAAAGYNHVTIMERLVEAGAGLDTATYDGRTPLMGAAVRGSTVAVEWLLARGADWRKVDISGRTALKLTRDSKVATVLEAWARKHSTISGDFEVGQLVTIVGLVGRPELNGCVGQIRSFDEAKGRFTVALIGDLTVSDSVNVKPSNLRLTSQAGLSAAGGGAGGESSTDSVGEPAEPEPHMEWAATRGKDEAKKRARQKANASQKALEVSLLEVAANGWLEEVKRLLTQGVNANAANSQGVTALHLAAAHHVNFMEILVDAGADLNTASVLGITPLMAAGSMATAAVEWLLARGADWRKTDICGTRALEYAQADAIDSPVAKLLHAWALKRSTTTCEVLAALEPEPEPEPPAMNAALDLGLGGHRGGTVVIHVPRQALDARRRPLRPAGTQPLPRSPEPHPAPPPRRPPRRTAVSCGRSCPCEPRRTPRARLAARRPQRSVL